ncbi:MAG: glycosyltransferase family 4 protein [Gemmataceae bacterium]
MVIAPLRIAVFTYGLPVPGQKRGGIERVAHELSDGLARRGHRVVVWTYDPRPDSAAYDVRQLPGKRFVVSWLGRRLTMGYLGNLIPLLTNFGRSDVVLALGDSLLLALTNRRVLRVMLGSALGEARSATSPWRAALQTGVYCQELLTAAVQSSCVGISENTRHWNPFVRRMIPCGVDLTVFYPEPNSKTGRPSILFVGALTGRKRGGRMIEWFTRRIQVAVPDATLDMVGPSGPLLPGVTYHIGLTDRELAGLYRRAWVYASPSSYEGFGLPYLEAMASGTPVVATPNPGSRELLEGGKYGVLADDGAFADRVVRLLKTDSERAELAEHGLAQAERYSLACTIDRYEELLGTVCLPRKSRRFI